MERYLKFKMEKKDSPLTVEHFLKKQAQLTKRQISQAKFRRNGITKNGIRCRVTETAYPGDIICICLEESETASSQLETFSPPQNSRKNFSNMPALDILYEDEDLLAVNKPAKMVTHPTGSHYSDSLANLAASYFRQNQESVRIRPVGRLDQDTSGIVIFAKNQTAASRLQAPNSPCHIQKQYLAIVSGYLPVDSLPSASTDTILSALTENSDYELPLPEYWHTIDRPLMQDPSDHLKMKVCTDPDFLIRAKSAVTHYCVLFSCPGWSLVMLHLETGRTHQIRVHMASVGHPLLGDPLYHPFRKDSFSRAALHAWKVSFKHPFRQDFLSLKAPLPQDFSQIISEVL